MSIAERHFASVNMLIAPRSVKSIEGCDSTRMRPSATIGQQDTMIRIALPTITAVIVGRSYHHMDWITAWPKMAEMPDRKSPSPESEGATPQEVGKGWGRNGEIPAKTFIGKVVVLLPDGFPVRCQVSLVPRPTAPFTWMAMRT